MLLLYRIGIWLYKCVIISIKSVNSKAKLFWEGRLGLLEKISDELKQKENKRVWVHAASLGEFEQGRPVIEALKEWDPKVEIVLTFFSPSGYEIRKNYELADHIFYLPLDQKKDADQFVSLVEPDLAVFVKYELWYFYLMALKNQNIKSILVSGIFRSDQFYFHPMGRFYRLALQSIKHYFVQDQKSFDLLRKIDLKQVTLSGDTRFDRVKHIADQAKKLDIVESYLEGEKNVLVLGSVWQSDMKVIQNEVERISRSWKVIIAPHNIGESEVEKLSKIENSVRYSKFDKSSYRVLIMDNMGLLSSTYRYAKVAYVGGAFNGNLHNTIEAAVYGIPVIWGYDDTNQKFREAQELRDVGGGFEITSSNGFEKVFELLEKESEYLSSAEASKEYVNSRLGATEKILDWIKTEL